MRLGHQQTAGAHGVSGSQIRGLGISAQGKGLFLLDKSDRPLGKAILSSDRRAMEIIQRWQKKRFRKNSTR